MPAAAARTRAAVLAADVAPCVACPEAAALGRAA
jgi:hypothetical protein